MRAQEQHFDKRAENKQKFRELKAREEMEFKKQTSEIQGGSGADEQEPFNGNDSITNTKNMR